MIRRRVVPSHEEESYEYHPPHPVHRHSRLPAFGPRLGHSATAQLLFQSRFLRHRRASKKSKADEWAQGFIFNYRSGYTPGAVGFGLDALGVVGVKLDSSSERTGTGLLPELPVLMFSDIRLPPPYQGASLVSNELPGLTL